MTTPLKLLIAEDNPADAELLLRALRGAGFTPESQRVDTEASYLDHLHAGLDLVISDYEMPQFSGLRALEILKQTGLDLPFILVSGTIGEDTAVAAMKLGAADYLLKDRLTRLGQAVTHALEQGRLRRARQQAETDLQEANANLQHLVSRSPTVIYSLKGVNGDGPMNYVSPNVSALTGFTVEETLRPEWWRERLHPDDQESVLAGLHTADEAGGSRVEYRLKHKNDHFIWVEDRRRRLPGSSGEPEGIVGGWTEITARKEAEDALRESVERFQQLADNVHEVFWITDPASKQLLYVSPAYEKIWGFARDALYRDPENWLKAIYPEDQPRIVAAMARQPEGAYDEIYRIVRTDGTLRWIRDRAFTVRKQSGEIYRLVGVAEDITERKKLEEEFFHAQRLESVGLLACGIAHDMNNILAPILMAVSLVRLGSTAAQAETFLSTIETSAQRGAGLVRQLLTFGRGADGARHMVNPAGLVRELIKIAQQTFPKNISIVSEIPENIWPILGDSTQLHQVLLNLGVNARDAMPQGGTLTTGLKNVTVDESYAAMTPGAKPGPHVLLRVEDTGMGIAPGIIDRIFDPFFTTKEVGKGTGLGLSTVVGIVKSHGGFVRLQSILGRGSDFQVYLPAVPDGKEKIDSSRDSAIARGHGELLLVVDDEEVIRDVVRAVLVQHGYRVITAQDGADATNQFARQPNEIEAVITDLDMPVMDGVTLIRVLRKINPDLPIIISTGIASNSARGGSNREIESLGVKTILKKPYTAETVLQAVHRLFI